MRSNNPLQQFYINSSSRAFAIKAKCAECVGCTPNHLERGFKESISSCSSESCPLHRFRPYQREKFLEGQKTSVQSLSMIGS
jgi:ribosome modulation factor